MEIQHGKGPWAPPVSGIVPLGSTLTLVVAINDFRGKINIMFEVIFFQLPLYVCVCKLRDGLNRCRIWRPPGVHR